MNSWYQDITPADVQNANTSIEQVVGGYAQSFILKTPELLNIWSTNPPREPQAYISNGNSLRNSSSDAGVLSITCGECVPEPNRISESSNYAINHPTRVNWIYLLLDRQVMCYKEIWYTVPQYTQGMIVLPLARLCKHTKFTITFFTHWQSSVTIYSGMDTSELSNKSNSTLVRPIRSAFVCSEDVAGGTGLYSPVRLFQDNGDYIVFAPFDIQPLNEESDIPGQVFPRGSLTFTSDSSRWYVSGTVQMMSSNQNNSLGFPLLANTQIANESSILNVNRINVNGNLVVDSNLNLFANTGTFSSSIRLCAQTSLPSVTMYNSIYFGYNPSTQTSQYTLSYDTSSGNLVSFPGGFTFARVGIMTSQQDQLVPFYSSANNMFITNPYFGFNGTTGIFKAPQFQTNLASQYINVTGSTTLMGSMFYDAFSSSGSTSTPILKATILYNYTLDEFIAQRNSDIEQSSSSNYNNDTVLAIRDANSNMINGSLLYYDAPSRLIKSSNFGALTSNGTVQISVPMALNAGLILNTASTTGNYVSTGVLFLSNSANTNQNAPGTVLTSNAFTYNQGSAQLGISNVLVNNSLYLPYFANSNNNNVTNNTAQLALVDKTTNQLIPYQDASSQLVQNNMLFNSARFGSYVNTSYLRVYNNTNANALTTTPTTESSLIQQFSTVIYGNTFFNSPVGIVMCTPQLWVSNNGYGSNPPSLADSITNNTASLNILALFSSNTQTLGIPSITNTTLNSYLVGGGVIDGMFAFNNTKNTLTVYSNSTSSWRNMAVCESYPNTYGIPLYNPSNQEWVTDSNFKIANPSSYVSGSSFELQFGPNGLLSRRSGNETDMGVLYWDASNQRIVNNTSKFSFSLNSGLILTDEPLVFQAALSNNNNSISTTSSIQFQTTNHQFTNTINSAGVLSKQTCLFDFVSNGAGTSSSSSLPPAPSMPLDLSYGFFTNFKTSSFVNPSTSNTNNNNVTVHFDISSNHRLYANDLSSTYQNSVTGGIYSTNPVSYLCALGGPYSRLNIGVGSSEDLSCAQVNMSSSKLGVLIPRLNSSAISSIPNPVESLLAYNSSTHTMNIYTFSSADTTFLPQNLGWRVLATQDYVGTAILNTIQDYLSPTFNQLTCTDLNVSHAIVKINDQADTPGNNSAPSSSTFISGLEIVRASSTATPSIPNHRILYRESDKSIVHGLSTNTSPSQYTKLADMESSSVANGIPFVSISNITNDQTTVGNATLVTSSSLTYNTSTNTMQIGGTVQIGSNLQLSSFASPSTYSPGSLFFLSDPTTGSIGCALASANLSYNASTNTLNVPNVAINGSLSFPTISTISTIAYLEYNSTTNSNAILGYDGSTMIIPNITTEQLSITQLQQATKMIIGIPYTAAPTSSGGGSSVGTFSLATYNSSPTYTSSALYVEGSTALNGIVNTSSDLIVGGNMTIYGTLDVKGQINQINYTYLAVENNMIELNTSTSSTPSSSIPSSFMSGFEIILGSTLPAQYIQYRHLDQNFVLGTSDQLKIIATRTSPDTSTYSGGGSTSTTTDGQVAFWQASTSQITFSHSLLFNQSYTSPFTHLSYSSSIIAFNDGQIVCGNLLGSSVTTPSTSTIPTFTFYSTNSQNAYLYFDVASQTYSSQNPFSINMDISSGNSQIALFTNTPVGSSYSNRFYIQSQDASTPTHCLYAYGTALLNNNTSTLTSYLCAQPGSTLSIGSGGSTNLSGVLVNFASSRNCAIQIPALSNGPPAASIATSSSSFANYQGAFYYDATTGFVNIHTGGAFGGGILGWKQLAYCDTSSGNQALSSSAIAVWNPTTQSFSTYSSLTYQALSSTLLIGSHVVPIISNSSPTTLSTNSFMIWDGVGLTNHPYFSYYNNSSVRASGGYALECYNNTGNTSLPNNSGLLSSLIGPQLILSGNNVASIVHRCAGSDITSVDVTTGCMNRYLNIDFQDLSALQTTLLSNSSSSNSTTVATLAIQLFSPQTSNYFTSTISSNTSPILNGIVTIGQNYGFFASSSVSTTSSYYSSYFANLPGSQIVIGQGSSSIKPADPSHLVTFLSNGNNVIRLPLLTSSEIQALTPYSGTLCYNTSTGAFQAGITNNNTGTSTTTTWWSTLATINQSTAVINNAIPVMNTSTGEFNMSNAFIFQNEYSSSSKVVMSLQDTTANNQSCFSLVNNSSSGTQAGIITMNNSASTVLSNSSSTTFLGSRVILNPQNTCSSSSVTNTAPINVATACSACVDIKPQVASDVFQLSGGTSPSTSYAVNTGIRIYQALSPSYQDPTSPLFTNPIHYLCSGYAGNGGISILCGGDPSSLQSNAQLVIGRMPQSSVSPFYAPSTIHPGALVTIGPRGDQAMIIPVISPSQMASLPTLNGASMSLFAGALALNSSSHVLEYHDGTTWQVPITSISLDSSSSSNLQISRSSSSTPGSVLLSLKNTSIASGTYTYTSLTIDSYGMISAIANGTPPTTTINGGAGITVSNDPVLGATISLMALFSTSPSINTASYPTQISWNPYGQVTSVVSGSQPVTAINVASNSGLTGSISNGTLSLNLSSPLIGMGSGGTFAYPSSISMNSYGQITQITAGNPVISLATAPELTTSSSSGNVTLSMSAIPAISTFISQAIPYPIITLNASGQIVNVSSNASNVVETLTSTSNEIQCTKDATTHTYNLALAPVAGLTAGTYEFPVINVDTKGRFAGAITSNIPSINMAGGRGMLARSTATSSGVGCAFTPTPAYQVIGTTSISFGSSSVPVVYGLQGCASDGTYMYYINGSTTSGGSPLYNNSVMMRVDMRTIAYSSSSSSSYAFTSYSPYYGYSAVCYDGQGYLYLAPGVHRTQSSGAINSHGVLLRINISDKSLQNFENLSTLTNMQQFDLTTINPNYTGYSHCIYEDPYVYLIPNQNVSTNVGGTVTINPHGYMIRFNTRSASSLQDPTAYTMINLAASNTHAVGFSHAISVGQYLYLSCAGDSTNTWVQYNVQSQTISSASLSTLVPNRPSSIPFNAYTLTSMCCDQNYIYICNPYCPYLIRYTLGGASFTSASSYTIVDFTPLGSPFSSLSTGCPASLSTTSNLCGGTIGSVCTFIPCVFDGRYVYVMYNYGTFMVRLDTTISINQISSACSVLSLTYNSTTNPSGVYYESSTNGSITSLVYDQNMIYIGPIYSAPSSLGPCVVTRISANCTSQGFSGPSASSICSQLAPNGFAIGSYANLSTLLSSSSSSSSYTNSLLLPGPLGVGTSTPLSCAIAQFNSTTQGVLLPSLTSYQKQVFSNAQQGVTIFDTTFDTLSFYSTSIQAFDNVISSRMMNLYYSSYLNANTMTLYSSPSNVHVPTNVSLSANSIQSSTYNSPVTSGCKCVLTDGKYVYFLPGSIYNSANSNYSSIYSTFVRYDPTYYYNPDSTHYNNQDVKCNAAYTSIDLSTIPLAYTQEVGFSCGVFDGKRYIYLIPFFIANTTNYAYIVRYDTMSVYGFSSTLSYSCYAIYSSLFTNNYLFGSCVYNFPYLYMIPFPGSNYAIMVFDTRTQFDASSSYTIVTPNSFLSKTILFSGSSCFDGRYIYCTDISNSAYLVRYDTQSSYGISNSSSYQIFQTSLSLSGLNAYPSGTQVIFYTCAFDGIFVYFIPGGDASSAGSYSTSSQGIVRYDTRLNTSFTSATAYQVFTPPTISAGIFSKFGGFRGAVYDGRYLYLIPSTNTAIFQYDTTTSFTQSTSYTGLDLHAYTIITTASNPMYANGLRLGNSIYIGPGEGSNILLQLQCCPYTGADASNLSASQAPNGFSIGTYAGVSNLPNGLLVSGQVGIGTAAVDPSAALQVTSTLNNQGFLPPIVTTSSVVQNSSLSYTEGLTIYDPSIHAPCFFCNPSGGGSSGAWRMTTSIPISQINSISAYSILLSDTSGNISSTYVAPPSAMAGSVVLIGNANAAPSWSSTIPSSMISSITQVGTITSGTWNANIIGVAYGGTGASSFASNALLVGNGSSAVNTLSVGTSGSILIGNTGALPSWSTTLPSSILSAISQVGTIVSGTWNANIIGVVYGGTGSSSLSANALLLGNGTSALNTLSVGSTGTILIGNTNAAPSWSSTIPNSILLSITQLGTIATGTWNAGVIGVAYGGTGVSTLSTNALVIGNGSSAISSLSVGTTGSILIGNTGAAPSWSSSLPSSILSTITQVGTIVSGTWNANLISVSYGGTGVSSLSANALVIGNGPSAISSLSVGITGSILVGNTNSAPTWSTSLPSSILSAISQVGTLTSGIWNASVISVAYGGTGASTLTANALILGNGTSALGSLSVGSTGSILIGNTGAAPSWSSSLPSSILSSITQVGTLTSGTWNASVISVAYGGTGASTLTANALILGNGTSALGSLSVGSTGSILIGNTGAAPSWSSSLPSGMLSSITQVGTLTSGTWNASVIGVTYGGTGSSSLTANALLLGNGTSALGSLSVGSTGSILIGNTGAAPSWSSSLPSGMLSSITQVGTLTNGIWNASVIGVAYGGTGSSSLTANALLLGNGTSALSSLSIGSTGSILIGNTGAAPSWSSSLPSGMLSSITQVGTLTSGTWNASVIGVAYGGTGSSSLTTNALLLGNGTSALGSLSVGSSGSILIGNTGAAPSWSSSLPSGMLSSITQVGTLTSGTWNASVIGVAYGGTGSSSLTANALLLGNGTSAISSLSIGSTGTILIGNTGAAPSFSNTLPAAVQSNISTIGAVPLLASNTTLTLAESNAETSTPVSAINNTYYGTITIPWSPGSDGYGMLFYVINANSVLNNNLLVSTGFSQGTTIYIIDLTAYGGFLYYPTLSTGVYTYLYTSLSTCSYNVSSNSWTFNNYAITYCTSSTTLTTSNIFVGVTGTNSVTLTLPSSGVVTGFAFNIFIISSVAAFIVNSSNGGQILSNRYEGTCLLVCISSTNVAYNTGWAVVPYVMVSASNTNIQTFTGTGVSYQAAILPYVTTSGTYYQFQNTSTGILFIYSFLFQFIVSIPAGNIATILYTSGAWTVSSNVPTAGAMINDGWLVMNSTSSALVPPRVTTSQKTSISTPASGSVVYDTTLGGLSIYNGTFWTTGPYVIYQSSMTSLAGYQAIPISVVSNTTYSKIEVLINGYVDTTNANCALNYNNVSTSTGTAFSEFYANRVKYNGGAITYDSTNIMASMEKGLSPYYTTFAGTVNIYNGYYVSSSSGRTAMRADFTYCYSGVGQTIAQATGWVATSVAFNYIVLNTGTINIAVAYRVLLYP